MGDDIQSIKAGILEIADVLVVNKADRPGAGNTVKVLRMMLHMGQSSTGRHHGQVLEAPAGGARRLLPTARMRGRCASTRRSRPAAKELRRSLRRLSVTASTCRPPASGLNENATAAAMKSRSYCRRA